MSKPQKNRPIPAAEATGNRQPCNTRKKHTDFAALLEERTTTPQMHNMERLTDISGSIFSDPALGQIRPPGDGVTRE